MSRDTLLLRVAELSFKQGLIKEKVADKLFSQNLLPSSDARVMKALIEETGSWLLDRHDTLLEIESANTPERQLEDELCRVFGLMDAIVVPGGQPSSSGYAPLDEHAKAAALYFEGKIAEAEDREQYLHVAVSGGQTILDMVNSLAVRRRSDVIFYAASLIGRGKAAQGVAHIGPEANATVAWSRSGNLPRHLCYGTVKPYYIDQDTLREMDPEERHPFVMRTLAKQREALLDSPGVQETLEDMNTKINFVIGGLGLLQPTPEEIGGKFTERISMTWLLKALGIDLGILAQAGCVGDMCYAMFDKNGKKHDDWHFFITVGDGSVHEGVDFYRDLVTEKKVPVMVVAGARKEKVLLQAMKAKLFNVLVTDSYTAKRLLVP